MPRPKNFEELIQIARSHPDMLGALSSIGVELKHLGYSRYGEQYKVSTAKGIEGDLSSVVFCANYDGSWVAIDNKERTGDKNLGSISIMRELFGMSFDEAVYALTGTAPVEGRSEYRAPKPFVKPLEAPPAEPFVLPEKRSGQSWKGIRYLTKERLIPEPIVTTFFDMGLVYMPTILAEKTKKQLDYVCAKMFDVNDRSKVVGIEGDATYLKYNGERDKHVKVEQKPQNSGFWFRNNVTEVTDQTPVFFCESWIDAISLFVLKNYPGVYVSLSGTKDAVFLPMIEKLGGKPVICTDNDAAGNRLREKFPQYDSMIPEYGKDWNAELGFMVVHGLDYALKGESALKPEDIQYYKDYMVFKKLLMGAASAEKDDKPQFTTVPALVKVPKMNNPAGIPSNAMTEGEFLAFRGLDNAMSAQTIDRLRNNRQLRMQRGEDRFEKELLEASVKYPKARDRAISEYKNLIAQGIIRDKTPLERQLTVAHGHPNLESTQVARQLLEKRGFDWRTGEKLEIVSPNPTPDLGKQPIKVKI